MFLLLKWKRGKKLLLKTVKKVERSLDSPLGNGVKVCRAFFLLWAQIMHGSMEPHLDGLRWNLMEYLKQY